MLSLDVYTIYATQKNWIELNGIFILEANCYHNQH